MPGDFINFHRSPIQILGNVRSVLRQMIDCARDLLKGKEPDRGEMVKEIAEASESYFAKVARDAEKDKDKITIASWKKALHDFLESAGNITVILDSFSGSYATSDAYRATFPGQSLDSGGWSGVGHGVAMGFGV